ncbi:MAG: hypothetical protein IJZ10_00760 [Thermoguttaceae bacterium]|nr:hypothetical protein [Thermoguttaceae bacterium]
MKTTRKKPGPRPRRLRRLRLNRDPNLEQRVFGSGWGRVVRAYRIEGRALTGFEAAKIGAAAAVYGKDEIVALAWRFGLRLTAAAPKEEILRTLYDALLIEPAFDATGRLVAPRFVYRPAERRFFRKDNDNEI